MRIKKVKKILGLSNVTIAKYRDLGIIKASKNKLNGYWDYDEDSVYSFASKRDKRDVVVYGRVSTSKQKNDLENQISTLIDYANKNGYKIDEVYQDIASGLTYDRKQFKVMIERVLKNEIKTIFVTYKDRMSRVSFDMWKSICDECDCDIIVINKEKDDEKEIFEDIISLLHCFSMRMYSKRRKRKLEIMEDDLKNEIDQ